MQLLWTSESILQRSNSFKERPAAFAGVFRKRNRGRGSVLLSEIPPLFRFLFMNDVPVNGEPQESEKEVSFGLLRLALFIKHYGSWLSLLF